MAGAAVAQHQETSRGWARNLAAHQQRLGVAACFVWAQAAQSRGRKRSSTVSSRYLAPLSRSELAQAIDATAVARWGRVGNTEPPLHRPAMCVPADWGAADALSPLADSLCWRDRRTRRPALRLSSIHLGGR